MHGDWECARRYDVNLLSKLVVLSTLGVLIHFVVGKVSRYFNCIHEGKGSEGVTEGWDVLMVRAGKEEAKDKHGNCAFIFSKIYQYLRK